MTPHEAQIHLARMIHAKATLDDVAVQTGRLIGAGVMLGAAIVAMVASWAALIGGGR